MVEMSVGVAARAGRGRNESMGVAAGSGRVGARVGGGCQVGPGGNQNKKFHQIARRDKP